MKRHRPKLSTLFSNHNVPTIATPEPIGPSSSSSNVWEWTFENPPPSRLDPDVEVMAQSLLSTLLADFHKALPIELNHLVLHVVEAYQKEVGKCQELESGLKKEIEETATLRQELSNEFHKHEEFMKVWHEHESEMRRLSDELDKKKNELIELSRGAIPGNIGIISPHEILARRPSEAIVITPSGKFKSC